MKFYHNDYWLLSAVKLILILAAMFVGCAPETKEKDVEQMSEGETIDDILYKPLDENNNLDTTDVAKISFVEPEYYFGEITEGDTIRRVFPFTNVGKKPLRIKKVQSTCGCTVPTYPEYLIAPGEMDSITVTFDTKDKEGYQSKAITVIANSFPNKTVVYLKGIVHSKN